MLYSIPTGWDLASHEFQTSNSTAVILARAWPDQQTAPPQPPHRVLTGTANWAFSDTSCYPGIAASLCACLCHSLNLCPLHNSWNELKLLSGCFPLALKDSSALFFPQSQQNIENGLHGKCEKWFLCKLEVMSAKLIC